MIFGIPGLLYSGIAGGTKHLSDKMDEGPKPTVTGFDPNRALSKENKLPGQNYFDDRISKDLIPSQLGRDQDYFSGLLNEGIEPNAPGPLRAEALPGDMSDPMVAALNEKAAADTSRVLRGITTRQHEGAAVAASDQASVAARNASAVHQNEVQNFMQQYDYQIKRYQLRQQYEQAKAQAKAQLFAGIFGGIGKVAGMAAGAA